MSNRYAMDLEQGCYTTPRFQGQRAAAVGLSCTPRDVLNLTRYLLLTCNFFLSFFNFAQFVRFIAHAGYLVNMDLNGTAADVESCYNVLKRASGHWHFGMRSYYYSVPMVAWIFGPYPLLVVGAISTVLIYYVDHPTILSSLPHSDRKDPAETELLVTSV